MSSRIIAFGNNSFSTEKKNEKKNYFDLTRQKNTKNNDATKGDFSFDKITKAASQIYDDLSEAREVKRRANDALASMNSESVTTRSFDSISDDIVQRNLDLANQAVKKNAETGLDISKYPYMKDGLTMFYSAGEVGNSALMKQANKLAYTSLEKTELKNKNNNFDGRLQNLVLNGDELNNPNKNEKLIYNPNKNGEHIIPLINDTQKNAGESLKKLEKTSIKMTSNNGTTRVISQEEIDSVFRKARNGAYTLNDEERAILNAAISNPSTPITRKNEIQKILTRENAKIIPMNEKIQKSLKNEEKTDKTFEESWNDMSEKVKEEGKNLANEGITATMKTALPVLNDAGNLALDNVPFVKDLFYEYVLKTEKPETSGDPEKNYEENKKLDLQKTGAMEGEFINDQGKLGDYKLGDSNIQDSGCGTIATYNVLQGMGVDVDFADVIHNSETSALLKGTLGMSPNGIAEVLENNGCEVTNDWLGVDENYDTEGSDAVIHLYFRKDGSAHYVAGISAGDGKYRFYNSKTEDTSPMTWEEYYNKNIDEDVFYSCTLNVKRKDIFEN